MKKILLAVTVIALAAEGVQNARAAVHHWATVGKVLTGIPVEDAIKHAIVEYHRYSTVVYADPYCPPARIVYQPPVYCAPAPVAVYRAPVYYAPAPVVTFRYGYGGGYRDGYRHSHHGRW